MIGLRVTRRPRRRARGGSWRWPRSWRSWWLGFAPGRPWSLGVV